MNELPVSVLKRVVKLMALTTSTNDMEALAAVRKANATLDREGVSWEKLLCQLSRGVSEDAPGWRTSKPAAKPRKSKLDFDVWEQINKVRMLFGDDVRVHAFLSDAEATLYIRGKLRQKQTRALNKLADATSVTDCLDVLNTV